MMPRVREWTVIAGAVLLACSAAASARDVTIDDTKVFPESLSADAAGRLYAGSLKGIIYRAEPGADKATPWIKPDDTNKLLWVLGVLAHDASNTLWVCTSPAPFRDPPALGDAAVVAFDLRTGAFKARYPLPAPVSACNDVAVARDGTVYVAETSNGRIFTIRPGSKAVSLYAQDPALVGVDGIAFSEGGILYVNNVRQNTMLRVDRDADGAYRGLTKLTVSAPLNGPDALRLYRGSTFLQAEAPAERLTLVTITGDKAEVKVVDERNGGSAAATHIAGTAYTAAGKIAYLFDPKRKGQDPGPFVIRAVPLGAAR